VAVAGLPTEVVPGPCAVSAALALSGLPASQYRFCGFLPRKGRERRESLAAIAAEPATVVLYEAANRVAATVSDLAAACGPERELAGARELTKLHEEVWRGTLGQAVEWLAETGEEPRGEWVLVLGPAGRRDLPPAGEEDIAAALRARLASGLDRRQAVAEVAAELRVPKRAVYDAALHLKDRG
jgi:16S rRNA (cytidine1402-2'-O)-methyltransferase